MDQFAAEVHRGQSYDIGLFAQKLDEWGYAVEDVPAETMAWMGRGLPAEFMPGMATDNEMERLRTAGDDTDAVFLALMVDHHGGGVGMAEEAAERAQDPDIRRLAERIASSQRAEIAELRGAAERLGLPLRPFGVQYNAVDPVTGFIAPQAHDH